MRAALVEPAQPRIGGHLLRLAKSRRVSRRWIAVYSSRLSPT
jgi:hypothetical protein